jgi:riboflavin kinase / FMN adenylyltransferase
VTRKAHHESLESAGRALPRRPLHLAIGMFDGVHLGHRAVIDAAVQSARVAGGVAAALTFDPHPSRLLRPDQPVRLIQPLTMKVDHLYAAELDAVIVERFTRELAHLEAEAFLPHLRERLPGLTAVYVGENWRFGRGRRGDIGLLNAEAHRLGLAVVSAPRINHNAEPISSTRIRRCLEEGDIQLANTLLGYVYTSEGVVQPGKRLGRTIGFPTLNVSWTPECQPRLGVYTVRVFPAENGIGLPGVANYGLRPTVEAASSPRLEVHVLGECPFGEGDYLRVEWRSFLRPEKRFADVDELHAQIARDVAEARAWHGL